MPPLGKHKSRKKINIISKRELRATRAQRASLWKKGSGGPKDPRDRLILSPFQKQSIKNKQNINAPLSNMKHQSLLKVLQKLYIINHFNNIIIYNFCSTFSQL